MSAVPRVRGPGWRNRLLANPRFQRWAARFPLTRPIARRRARELFDLTAGFAYSQVLYACVQLQLLPALQAGAQDQQALAESLELSPQALDHLLLAAEALGLVRRRGAAVSLGDLGAALLGNPGAQAMIAHHGALYRDLADPVALLRDRTDSHLARFWPYAGAAEPGAAVTAGAGPYSSLMAASQSLLADDLLQVLPVKGCRRLLDIAGGNGQFLAAALARWPQLQATLFDLPAVVSQAAELRADFCEAGRLELVGGDMFRDPLPAGADIATLVRVLHDHDDAAVERLLAQVHAALSPGARVVVAEPMAGTAAAPGVGAYFSLYLWAMGSGRPRTREEIFRLLAGAGFVRCRELRTPQPLVARVVVADVNTN